MILEKDSLLGELDLSPQGKISITYNYSGDWDTFDDWQERFEILTLITQDFWSVAITFTMPVLVYNYHGD